LIKKYENTREVVNKKLWNEGLKILKVRRRI